jgi:multidrug efflux pump subunit AcrB
MDIVRQSPGIAVLRDDWSLDSPQMRIEIEPDRANLVGITNADVAMSTAAAISGDAVGIYKEGNKNIPIVVRLRHRIAHGFRRSKISTSTHRKRMSKSLCFRWRP